MKFTGLQVTDMPASVHDGHALVDAFSEVSLLESFAQAPSVCQVRSAQPVCQTARIFTTAGVCIGISCAHLHTVPAGSRNCWGRMRIQLAPCSKALCCVLTSAATRMG